MICEENVDQNFKDKVQICLLKVCILKQCFEALSVAQQLDKVKIGKYCANLVELVQGDALLKD